jgi:hypothetical protein
LIKQIKKEKESFQTLSSTVQLKMKDSKSGKGSKSASTEPYSMEHCCCCSNEAFSKRTRTSPPSLLNFTAFVSRF